MLRLLHTADWHLGRRFPSFPEEAQKKRQDAELQKEHEAEIERFEKAKAIIGTVKPGDSWVDFTRKANDARLILEGVTSTPELRQERYVFWDNRGAFLIVSVRGDRIVALQPIGYEHEVTSGRDDVGARAPTTVPSR